MSGWGAIYNNSISAIRYHSQVLANLQEQVSTGQRIIRTSDDPTGANRIMHLRSQGRSLDTYIKNLDNSMLDLNQVSATLDSTSGALIRVQELVTQGATQTLNQNQRTAIANEIDGLLQQAIYEANQKSMGRYLFSGVDISTQPYVIERTDGVISSVTYQGARTDLLVPVGPEMAYSSLLVGEDVFRSHTRAAPQFLGSTGAAAATGTASMTGDIYLGVQHNNTTIQAPAHGLAKGDNSDANDTIVGTHTLTINADNTIQLDDGVVISFTPGQTDDVVVTTANGDRMYVDVENWDTTAAQITVVAAADLSVDEGVTTTTVTDFSTDATVLDADGRVLYVDPSDISSSGIEPIRVPGTYDLFGALINMRNLMNNTMSLSDDEQMRLMNHAIESIEEVSTGIRQQQACVGARIQAMDNLRASLDNTRYNNTNEADSMQQADIVEVATNLARTQTLYEMTLKTAGTLLSMSLLDFI